MREHFRDIIIAVFIVAVAAVSFLWVKDNEEAIRYEYRTHVESSVSDNAERVEHLMGLQAGTESEKTSSVMVGDRVIDTTVEGSYNVQGLGYGGSGVAVRSNRSTVGYAVGQGLYESAYVYAMDSTAGPLAMAALVGKAAELGAGTGPVIDINIGRRGAGDAITYPEEFPDDLAGVFIDLQIPHGFLKEGYEPAMICLRPDTSMEVLADRSAMDELCGFYAHRPVGVYMMVQVPKGSLQTYKDEEEATVIADRRIMVPEV